MINDHKASMKLEVQSRDETQFGECKIQLVMQVNFISFIDSEETCIWHTWSDNVEILMGSETDDIITEPIDSLLQRYQKELEESEKNGSNFIFDGIDLLSYHLHKTSLKRGKSYIESPEWLKNESATINPKIDDDNCFQYAITVALNHQNIEKHPERASNINPFVNWKDIDFPSHQKDWKKFEQYIKTIALNILYVPSNTKQIRLAYKSKYNRKRKIK